MSGSIVPNLNTLISGKFYYQHGNNPTIFHLENPHDKNNKGLVKITAHYSHGYGSYEYYIGVSIEAGGAPGEIEWLKAWAHGGTKHRLRVNRRTREIIIYNYR